jgi:hypothetical protein
MEIIIEIGLALKVGPFYFSDFSFDMRYTQANRIDRASFFQMS